MMPCTPFCCSKCVAASEVSKGRFTATRRGTSGLSDPTAEPTVSLQPAWVAPHSQTPWWTVDGRDDRGAVSQELDHSSGLVRGRRGTFPSLETGFKPPRSHGRKRVWRPQATPNLSPAAGSVLQAINHRKWSRHGRGLRGGGRRGLPAQLGELPFAEELLQGWGWTQAGTPEWPFPGLLRPQQPQCLGFACSGPFP